MASVVDEVERIEVGTCELELRRRGKGPVLLSLHGAKEVFPWHRCHDLLAERFTVVAPTHPGFAGTARAAEVESVDDLAFLYLDLIEAQGWRGVHLLGAGLGGWVAAELAVRDDSALASLTLIDAVGVKVSGRETADILDTYTMLHAPRAKALWHDPARGETLIGDPAAMSDEALEAFLQAEAGETLYGWRPYMHNPALLRRLHRIHVPTLVLWGESDGVVKPDYGRAYAGAIPGAVFETVAEAGHLPHVEQPEAVAGRVAAFIEKIGS